MKRSELVTLITAIVLIVSLITAIAVAKLERGNAALDIADKDKEIASLQASLSLAEDEKSGLSQDWEDFKNGKDGLLGQINTLSAANKKLKENELGAQAEQLRLIVANRQLEQTLQNRIGELILERDGLARDVEANNKFRTQVADIEGKLRTAEAERAALKISNADLAGQISKMRAEEMDRLNVLATAPKPAPAPVIPAAPKASELANWTWSEAIGLLRNTFSGTDVYRAPVFSRVLVPPLVWYQETITKVPGEILQDPWPAGFMGWFSTKYDGIITGYAVAENVGSREVFKVIAAHEQGKIGIYYLINGKWLKAGGAGDGVTPRIRAINLLE